VAVASAGLMTLIQVKVQVCTLLQTDNHTSTPSLCFYRRMPFLLPNQQRQSTEGKLGKPVPKGKTSLDLNEARDDGVGCYASDVAQ